MSSQTDLLINSIRRITGDNNPENYRISTKDLHYFLQDAVDSVQVEVPLGYEMEVLDTSVSFNKTLYAAPFAVFKLKTLEYVLESTFHDHLYHSGNLQIGDIKIDVVPILKLRMENLKRIKSDLNNLIYDLKMNYGNVGFEIDTYVTGLVHNVQSSDYLVYESQ